MIFNSLTYNVPPSGDGYSIKSYKVSAKKKIKITFADAGEYFVGGYHQHTNMSNITTGYYAEILDTDGATSETIGDGAFRITTTAGGSVTIGRDSTAGSWHTFTTVVGKWTTAPTLAGLTS